MAAKGGMDELNPFICNSKFQNVINCVEAPTCANWEQERTIDLIDDRGKPWDESGYRFTIYRSYFFLSFLNKLEDKNKCKFGAKFGWIFSTNFIFIHHIILGLSLLGCFPKIKLSKLAGYYILGA